MWRPWIACVTLCVVLVPLIKGSALPTGILPIALCTPESSTCTLASDGNASSCFVARKMEENFYFAVFNTVGQLATVSELKLLVGGAGRARYSVSLASNAQAHELRCASPDGDGNAKPSAMPHLLDCSTTDGAANNGLVNVSSLMIRSEPLQIRMRLLEVVAYTDKRKQIQFAYCSMEQFAGVCGHAMDGKFSLDSPLAVSDPAVFPSWFGGFDSSGLAPVAFVRIYRPYNDGATFFRVASASVDCTKTGESSISDGVEAIDYACRPGATAAASLLEVWEIDTDYLVSLCEIQVFGHEQ